MAQEFFQQRPEVNPTIYAYELKGVDSHKGYIKVGYTDRDVETRIKEQMHTSAVPYVILYQESAMCSDGSCFMDHDVHAILKRNGFHQLNEGEDKNEWFKCSINDVKLAISEMKTGIRYDGRRTQTFKMRPEQTIAVQRTMEYFQKAKKEDPKHSPKYLWNAKMRFGKCFASYELAKKMDLHRVLILTFKPAVEQTWHDDLMNHVNFENWQFTSNKDAKGNNINVDQQYLRADKCKPMVVFGSFQDLLGTDKDGNIKAKNEFIHAENWDLVIFDEYHFGAWRENAKKLFDNPDEEVDADFDQEKYKKEEADNAYNESWLPITTNYYLFLSGTPFRALNSGEFIEDQIYNWTYSDEQRAKGSWIGSENPYESLPRMVMMTYKIPDSIREIAIQGEFNEFDLNEFFGAEGKEADAKFLHQNEVQKWLDLIRGSYLPSSVDDLKLGQNNRPPMPYSDTRLLNVLSHTLWYLPNVASCYAMYNLLRQNQNTFYQDYTINVCAGTKAGIGLNALEPVQMSMSEPLSSKTITLSCGKLTTGVTVKPWTGVFMLRNLKSPESYFQTAFRAQSPWTIQDEYGNTQVIKQECYVFDFALDRALRQISDYATRLDINEGDPEKKVAEFISFLPVLAYDGSTMKQISAQDILDIAMAGTSATLLARRWESALLVNVDNDTLQRVLDSQEAYDAIMKIEGFRSLNNNTLEMIINRSNDVKDKKKSDAPKTEKDKKEITEEEKEIKFLRKQVQEKLIKFATRIPIFMYLTDYREKTLKDVITQLEPGLFQKVTGLGVEDFEMLCSINVFNASLMNDAIFKFKRYEDSSLSYTGIDKNPGSDVGGWDISIKKEEYERLFYNQQNSEIEETTENEQPLFAEITKIREYDAQNNKKETNKIKIDMKPKELISAAYGINAAGRSTVDYVVKYEQKSVIDMDLSMVKIGGIVIHSKFGEGTIVRFDYDQKYMKVQFSVGEKTFAFPNAFVDGFVKLK
ncbi:MAG: GIY-YIG nuclease family protein [Lachnospiraceae bacterium]